jgi:hypothetical protein
VEFEVFEVIVEGEVRRGTRQAPKVKGRRFWTEGVSGLRGFVNISSATRNLEVKYRDSGGFEGSEGSEA